MGKNLKGRELGTGITQRKDGKYMARFVSRRGERRTLYASSERDIKAKLAEEKARDASENYGSFSTMTLNEWFKKWMDVYKSSKIRGSTLSHYKSLYHADVETVLGHYCLCDIRSADVQGLLNRLVEKGLKGSTCVSVKVLLHQVLDSAVDNELISSNPVRGVGVRQKEKSNRRALTLEEQELFFRCSSGTFYDNLFRTAISTGLRIGELAALTKADIDFEQSCIHVTKTLCYSGAGNNTYYVGEPKTKNSYRAVPFANGLDEIILSQIALSEIIKQRQGTNWEFLFLTKTGVPITSQICGRAISNILKEINLQRTSVDQIQDFSMHTFRHTFATRCLENGIAPKVVQAYLGHSTIMMTMDLYTHVQPAFMEDEIKKLSFSFGEK